MAENGLKTLALCHIFCVLLFIASFVLILTGFVRNDWMTVTNDTHEYQRGLNSDCVKPVDLSSGVKIRCRKWKNLDKEWYDSAFGEVRDPDFAWQFSWFAMWLLLFCPLIFLALSIIFCCCVGMEEKIKSQTRAQRALLGLAGTAVFFFIVTMMIVVFRGDDSVLVQFRADCHTSMGYAVVFSGCGVVLFLIGVFLLFMPSLNPILSRFGHGYQSAPASTTA